MTVGTYPFYYVCMESCIWCRLGFRHIPYSRKYWWELNLAVGFQMAIAKVLVDFNLAVRYVRDRHTYICE